MRMIGFETSVTWPNKCTLSVPRNVVFAVKWMSAAQLLDLSWTQILNIYICASFSHA